MRSAGFDPVGIDPRTLWLGNQGHEVAIYVAGEDDSVLDENDYVEFYGQAMAGPFTARNAYWLVAGQGPGRRMASRQVHPATAPTATSFWRAVHFEEDHVYWQNPSPGTTFDHWFWQGYLQAPATTAVTFSLVPPAPESAQAILRVSLQGRSDDLAVSPNHHTRIALNGTLVGDAYWDGQVTFQHHK
jgi:hypothetical protein